MSLAEEATASWEKSGKRGKEEREKKSEGKVRGMEMETHEKWVVDASYGGFHGDSCETPSVTANEAKSNGITRSTNMYINRSLFWHFPIAMSI